MIVSVNPFDVFIGSLLMSLGMLNVGFRWNENDVPMFAITVTIIGICVLIHGFVHP